jgi:hypothetical protein
VQASGFAEMKLPFGALASRGQSIAEREQANKQAQKQLKDKFDPYGGVGKAADPFQPAFGKYAMTTLNKLADDIIKAYGGDEEEGWKRIRTPGTQENQLWLQKSREISDVGTANQYEFKQYADLYADVVAGKQKVDPETREALRTFLSAQNELGIPVEGVDPAEFRSMRRDLEGMVSAATYMNEFMKTLPNMVQSVAQELGKAVPVGGGRYALQDLAKKEFEPSLRVFAQEYSASSGGKITPEEAYETFSKVFNDELERKTSTWSPRADSGGDGGGGKDRGAPMVTASIAEVPASSTGGVVRGPQEQLMLTPYQVTGDKPHKVSKMNVTIGDAKKDLYAPSMIWDEDRGGFFLEGVSLSDTEETKVRNEASSGWTQPKEGENWNRHLADVVVTTKAGAPTKAPTKTNKDALEVYYGSRNEYEIIAQQLKMRGFDDASAERIERDWADKFKRKKLITFLGQ